VVLLSSLCQPQSESFMVIPLGCGLIRLSCRMPLAVLLAMNN
jgi:hypothetical protein